jgi:hypothetical protein
MTSLLEDQLSWALCRILELEELLEEALDINHRLVEGDGATEWQLGWDA